MLQKRALITGGIGDIGTAICQEFHRQGSQVIAADNADQTKILDWQQHQKSLGFDINVVNMNVTQYENCQQMAKEIEINFGPVDILINGAGTINDVTLRKMTKEQWDQVVHTDLDSIFNVTRQFINGMIERKYGRIINISSVNAIKGQFGQCNYAAAKAGIYGFTKSLAYEVAKFGITVNSVSPGYVESRMIMSVPFEIRKKILEQIPVGRFAAPEEIAWAIAFLASRQSGFITGTNLNINGGLYMD